MNHDALTTLDDETLQNLTGGSDSPIDSMPVPPIPPGTPLVPTPTTPPWWKPHNLPA